MENEFARRSVVDTAARHRLISALPPDAKAAALAFLDEITRPMTDREIEWSLQPLFSRSQRLGITKALRPAAIVIIHLGEK